MLEKKLCQSCAKDIAKDRPLKDSPNQPQNARLSDFGTCFEVDYFHNYDRPENSKILWFARKLTR